MIEEIRKLQSQIDMRAKDIAYAERAIVNGITWYYNQETLDVMKSILPKNRFEQKTDKIMIGTLIQDQRIINRKIINKKHGMDDMRYLNWFRSV